MSAAAEEPVYTLLGGSDDVSFVPDTKASRKVTFLSPSASLVTYYADQLVEGPLDEHFKKSLKGKAPTARPRRVPPSFYDRNARPPTLHRAPPPPPPSLAQPLAQPLAPPPPTKARAAPAPKAQSTPLSPSFKFPGLPSQKPLSSHWAAFPQQSALLPASAPRFPLAHYGPYPAYPSPGPAYPSAFNALPPPSTQPLPPPSDPSLGLPPHSHPPLSSQHDPAFFPTSSASAWSSFI